MVSISRLGTPRVFAIAASIRPEEMSANFEKAKLFVKTLSDYISQRLL